MVFVALEVVLRAVLREGGEGGREGGEGGRGGREGGRGGREGREGREGGRGGEWFTKWLLLGAEVAHKVPTHL